MDKKLNILFFSWRGPGHPNAGGAEKSTHEHAKGWVKNGYNVTLFTTAFKGGKEYEVIDGVHIIRRGGQILGVQYEAYKWYLFKKDQRFDLVIDQFHGIPFFTPLFVRTKKLGFIHEVTKEVWRLNPWPIPLNLIPAILGPLFEPLIFKVFYKGIPFMTVSESTKKDLIGWGIPENRVTVIHNGVEVPVIENKPIKEKNKTIIYLGALSKDKGIEEALIIFSIIKKIKRDWQFWVVGKSDPTYLKKLKNKAKLLGIEKKIKFFGYVSEEEKFKFLCRSHVAINPSVREGWGIVVIEAASMGIPTVAFDVAGLRDSILNGKTGILISDKSAKNLSLEIINLIEDQKKYNQIRKNAISWSKNFSWDKSAKKSLQLIEKLVRAN